MRNRSKLIYLLSIILLSILFTSISHGVIPNEGDVIVGDDTKDYADLIVNMKNSKNTMDLLQTAFFLNSGGDRGLSLMFFYFIIQTVGSDNNMSVIDNLPFILGPLLILSIFFLAKEMTCNDEIALFAAFLSNLSFQITIGTYAGFYANWFALVFSYFAMVFLFRIFKKNTIYNFFMFTILNVLILLSHSPTWTIFSLFFVGFSIIQGFTRLSSKKNIFYIAVAILPSWVIDIMKMTHTKYSGIIQDISFAKTQDIGIHNLSNVWSNLHSTAHIYVGGQFGNFILLSLVVYWIANSKLRDRDSLFFLILFSLISFPIFFGSYEILSRLLYIIPFQIPAAIALYHIKSTSGILVVTGIFVSILALTIRTISNFQFTIPS